MTNCIYKINDFFNFLLSIIAIKKFKKRSFKKHCRIMYWQILRLSWLLWQEKWCRRHFSYPCRICMRKIRTVTRWSLKRNPACWAGAEPRIRCVSCKPSIRSCTKRLRPTVWWCDLAGPCPWPFLSTKNFRKESFSTYSMSLEYISMNWISQRKISGIYLMCYDCGVFAQGLFPAGCGWESQHREDYDDGEKSQLSHHQFHDLQCGSPLYAADLQEGLVHFYGRFRVQTLAFRVRRSFRISWTLQPLRFGQWTK